MSPFRNAAAPAEFLADYDPKCKAMEDYQLAGAQLLELLSDPNQTQPEGAQAILQA